MIAAFNKWMQARIDRNCTIHSFQHSMRDRLREIECPNDIIDQFCGWLSQGIGNSYGKGYQIEQIEKWVYKVEGEFSGNSS